MTIKSAGELRLHADIENEFEEVIEPDIDIALSVIAEDADLFTPSSPSPIGFSSFYGVSSGPKEFFASFSVVAGQHTNTISFSISREDGGTPTGTIFIYGQEGENLTIDEDNLLNPDGLDINQTSYSHFAGYNTQWSYRIKLVNDRGDRLSEQRLVESIPTLPSFDAQISVSRDPEQLGTNDAQKTVAVTFDLTDEIAFREGYTIEIYYKINDNQNFAQIDSTLSKSSAINSDNPVTQVYEPDLVGANQAQTIKLEGLEFELFTRYTFMIYIQWTNQEGSSRGLLDFAGDRPEIPLLTAVTGPNTIQVNWSHDNKSIRYELYRHSQEVNVIENGEKIYEISTTENAGSWEPVTQRVDQIGYNTFGYYVVKAFTEFDEAISSVKRAETLVTQPRLDGGLTVARDPNNIGHSGGILVGATWDMENDGPPYNEGYNVDFYWKSQDSGFIDTSLTRETADNAGSPVSVSRSGNGVQSFNLEGKDFDQLTRYTILMVLTWLGEEVSSRAFIDKGNIPDAARGFSVFQSGNKGLRISWSDDGKTDTYELYASSSSGSNLKAEGASKVKTATGGSASYEHVETLDYATTRYYQVVSYNQYSPEGVLSGVRSGTTSEPSLAIQGSAQRSGSSMTDVSVSWTVLPSDLTGYSVGVTINGSSKSVTPTAGSATFSGAAPSHDSTYSVEFTLSWGSKAPARTTATVPIFTAMPLPIPQNLSYSAPNVSWSAGSNGNSNTVTSYRLAAKIWNHGDAEQNITTDPSTWYDNGASTSYGAGTLNRQYMKWAVVAYAGTVNGLMGAPSQIATTTFVSGTPDDIGLSTLETLKNSMRVRINFSDASTVTGWRIEKNGQTVQSGNNPTGNTEVSITGLSAGTTYKIEAFAYWAFNRAENTKSVVQNISTTADYTVTMGKPVLSWSGDNLRVTVPSISFSLQGGQGSVKLDFGVSGATIQSYSNGQAGEYTSTTANFSAGGSGTFALTLSPKTWMSKLGYAHSWYPTGCTFSVTVTITHPTGSASASSQSETISTTGANAHKLMLATTSGTCYSQRHTYGTGSTTYKNDGTATGSNTTNYKSADHDRIPILFEVKTRNGTRTVGATVTATGVTGNAWMDGHVGTDHNNSVSPTINNGLLSFAFDERSDRFRDLNSFTWGGGTVSIKEGSAFNTQTVPMENNNISVQMPRFCPSARHYAQGHNWGTADSDFFSGTTWQYRRRLRYSYYQGTTSENGLVTSNGTTTAVAYVDYKTTSGAVLTNRTTTATQIKNSGGSPDSRYPYVEFVIYGVTEVTLKYFEITISFGGFTNTTRYYGNYSSWTSGSH